MYDEVKLITGEIARIVEIYEQGIAYEADVEKDEGLETDTIKPAGIEYVFVDTAAERTA